MVRIQGTALLRISQSTCLAYFTGHGLQPEKIAKVVCRQADAGTTMGIIRPSNPIMTGLRRLSLEFLRETHKKYFIPHEKIWIEGASDRVMYFAKVSVCSCHISKIVLITRSAFPLVWGCRTCVNFWPIRLVLQRATTAWSGVPLYSVPLSE